jgi:hypothetical protein
VSLVHRGHSPWASCPPLSTAEAAHSTAEAAHSNRGGGLLKPRRRHTDGDALKVAGYAGRRALPSRLPATPVAALCAQGCRLRRSPRPALKVAGCAGRRALRSRCWLHRCRALCSRLPATPVAALSTQRCRLRRSPLHSKLPAKPVAALKVADCRSPVAALRSPAFYRSLR